MRFRLVFRVLAAAALSALLCSASCSREKPGLTPGGPVSLTATAEGYKWAVGDAVFVTLSGGGSARLEVTQVKPTGTAVLEGSLPEGKALEGVAVFPYGSYQRHAGTLSLTLPGAWEGLQDHALLGAVVTPGTAGLAFKPLGGKVVLSYENIPSIARGAVFTSVSAPASGAFTLESGADGGLRLKSAASGGQESSVHIRFVPGDDATVTVPLPPGQYDGWSLALEDAEGKPIRYSVQRTGSLTVTPGSVFTREKVTLPKFHTAAAEKIYGFSDAVLTMYPDDVETTLGRGVTETALHFTKDGALQMHAWLIEADLSQGDNQLVVGAPYADNTAFGKKRQTLSAQAPLYVTETTRPTVIVNADFWAVSGTYKDQLRGPIHTGGQILKSTFLYEERLYQQALSYAGVRIDGSLSIQPKDRYLSEQVLLTECTGGGVIMLYDGEVPDLSAYTGIDPRTVIGYNGKTVYFLVVDGRQTDWSNGLTYAELGSIMKAVGCTSAVNLDGGGSAQLLVLNPETGKYEIRNRPADGKERAVAETWIISSDYAR